MKEHISHFQGICLICKDHVRDNDFFGSCENEDVAYIFPVKFCGHRWLKNRKTLKRALDINSSLKVHFGFPVDKKMSPKDIQF